jgi:transcription-repair coupling factor (superfamily II helicase)
LLITARPARALEFADELQAWLPKLPIQVFPERDALPYESLAPDCEAVRDRLRALDLLAQSKPAIIVTSTVAVAQRTLPANGATGSITLRVSDKTSPESLLRDLVALGYRWTDLVHVPGAMARRGGIIDVFAAASEAPSRIDFFGDSIESIRLFDPGTQRSEASRPEITLGPAREVLGLAAAVKDLLSDLDLDRCSAAARDRFEEHVARLQAGEDIVQEGFYLPLVATGSLLDHLRAGALLILDEAADIRVAIEEHDAQVDEVRRDLESRDDLPPGLPLPHAPAVELQKHLDRSPRLDLSRWADAPASAATDQAAISRLPFTVTGAYGGRLRALAADLSEAKARGRACVLVTPQDRRVAEILAEEGVEAQMTAAAPPPQAGATVLLHGSLPQGWRLATSSPPISLLTDSEIFGFARKRRAVARRAAASRDAFLSGLEPGHFVVHIEHGIARFVGLVERQTDGVSREYLELRYDRGDKLFVPVEQVDRVSPYVGPGDHQPALTRLGSQDWARSKERVRRAVADLANGLLELYASRQSLPGRAFSPDTAWQIELEASFPYVETPDQLTAVRDVKNDMMAARPMDRLVCGDVGYGKTEVAVRAAFKAVMDGTQVAVLVPTTVLAQQHFNTFSQRLAGYPVRIEMLSRFRSEKEQRQIVDALREGSVDIVIGTHRLIQKDIDFKNLGLVVIDEEQRFGVAHKERLKEIRREVDVLTLTATPIPRTLHMSMSGIRDMSTIETPPELRYPIKTYVAEYDDHVVREAVLREMERGGQVYFVHNRVHDIDLVAGRLRDLVPEAEIAVGHGQQPEDVLEHVMLDFIDGRTDVLVCTTIIESGLDIPNVNTIIIDKADKLGLAQLYQLRGRVGRGAAHAYAYLLFDRYRTLSEVAQRRLQAVFEATELGAGFQIAMRDLEIRGAGNLLGAEQSGHIGAVGFDLYVRLLSDAVERLKAIREGRPPPAAQAQQPAPAIDLPFSAHIPPSYVGDLNLRLALYQRLADVDRVEEIDSLEAEFADRFGALPPAVRNLLFTVRVRILARRAGVTSVQQDRNELVIRGSEQRSPRLRLAGHRIKGLRTGPTQARLDLTVLVAGWQDALIEILSGLAAEVAA